MVLSAAITAFYMLRLVYLTFAGDPRDKEKYEHAHESPWVMTVPLSVLAVFSVGTIWWGWFEHLVAKPELASFASGFAGAAETHEAAHGAASAHLMALGLSILAAGLGILLATVTYYWKKISAEAWGRRLKAVYKLLWNKYYFDELYGATVIKGTLLTSRIASAFDLSVIDGIVNGTAKATAGFSFAEGWFDLRIVDGLVNLVGRIVEFFSSRLREIQTGKVQSYILIALAGVVLLFIVQLF